MKKVLLEIFGMMLVCMGLVFGVSALARLILRTSGNYGGEIMYHISLIAGLCGLLLFAVLLNFLIIRRLKKLSAGVKEVAKGNYETVLADQGFDEIHTLALDFNEMSKELKANEYLNREYVRNVSHELKTPLGCIMGYAELIKKPERSRAEIEEYAAIIYAEAKRTLAIGTQMLELSRLNSTERVEGGDVFCPAEQIRGIVLSQQNEWLKKNIDMQIDLDDFETSGNENLTYHVWQNLISNAVKFADERGTITIRLKKDEKLCFEISNTGAGISDQDKPCVFRQFFTGDKTGQGRGTGLGLAITKKITELLSGKISFTSSPNLTTFFVEI